jgi:hypothetical protein
MTWLLFILGIAETSRGLCNVWNPVRLICGARRHACHSSWMSERFVWG